MDPITIGLALASQFAPGIIKYFSNSDTAATVAGQVIDIAKTVTGKGDIAALAPALAADPALALAFQQKVMDNDTDLYKASLADIQDARKRDIAFLGAGKRNVRADIMVALDVVGLLACLTVLCFFREKIPGEVVGLLSTVASIFGLCLRDAHQFEFGSSRASQGKDDTINKLSAK